MLFGGRLQKTRCCNRYECCSRVVMFLCEAAVYVNPQPLDGAMGFVLWERKLYCELEIIHACHACLRLCHRKPSMNLKGRLTSTDKLKTLLILAFLFFYKWPNLSGSSATCCRQVWLNSKTMCSLNMKLKPARITSRHNTSVYCIKVTLSIPVPRDSL